MKKLIFILIAIFAIASVSSAADLTYQRIIQTNSVATDTTGPWYHGPYRVTGCASDTGSVGFCVTVSGFRAVGENTAHVTVFLAPDVGLITSMDLPAVGGAPWSTAAISDSFSMPALITDATWKDTCVTLGGYKTFNPVGDNLYFRIDKGTAMFNATTVIQWDCSQPVK